MSYLDNHRQTKSVTLEWAYMIAGVLAVIISTTLLFGSDLAVNQSMNIVMAVALIGYTVYSSSSSKKLQNSLSLRENQAKELHKELEKAAEELSNLRFEMKEKKFQIDNLRREVAEYHDKTEDLQTFINELKAEIDESQND